MSVVMSRLGLGRADRLLLAAAAVTALLAGLLSATRVSAAVVFVVSGIALAVLTALVARAADRLDERFGSRATSALHATADNLPLLFVGSALLRAGLVAVAQAALVGAVLGNSLLVLGLAFVVGGGRHGVQRFVARRPRLIAALTVLAVPALAVPALAVPALAVPALAVPALACGVGAPAGAHTDVLSVVSALVFLVVFIVSAPVFAAGRPDALSADARGDAARWPRASAMAILAAAIVGAALVSGLFVGALPRATAALRLLPVFAGLVVVALAANVAGNTVGVRLAARDKPDDAVAVILTSSLQVALGVIPALALLSFVVGPTPFTLVWPGLLLAALGLAALLGAFIVFDGASTWLEGVALIGLYGIIAVTFWWG